MIDPYSGASELEDARWDDARWEHGNTGSISIQQMLGSLWK